MRVVDNRLFEAVVNCDMDGVKSAIAHGADVDVGNEHGDRPLHVAALNGYDAIIAVLIGARATLDCPNMAGDTPLHYAASSGHSEAGLLLTHAGADVNYNNYHNGNTPLHCAVKGGHITIVRLLAANGADMARRNLGQRPYDLAMSTGQKKIAKVIADITGPLGSEVPTTDHRGTLHSSTVRRMARGTSRNEIGD